MEGNLKVTPEQLIATADTMSNQASEVRNLTETMASIANTLQAAWEGEAATAYINKINQEKQDVMDCVQKIQTRLKELQEMARNYQSAESANESTASSLATDVVQL